MIFRLRLLAATTMREAARRKLVLMGALAGAAFLLLYGLAFHLAVANPGNIINSASRLVEQQAAGVFALLGLYAANLLVVTIAIIASVDALPGEIASGAMQTLLAKPIARWQLLLGKWLGFVALLTLFLLALEGGVMLIAWVYSGYVVPHALAGLALMWLEMVLLLTVTILAGTRLSSLASGIVALGLFGLAFLGGWIEQAGAITRHPGVVKLGIVASLVMPSEALWRRAAFEMKSPLASLFGAGPFVLISVPSPLMVGYAAAYAFLAMLLALRSFHTRDM